MPLRLIRSASNRTLWDACADRFLEQAARNPGPRGHQAHLWVTHRGLRDSLLERAYDRGIEGWLAPPISFFSELPDRFGLAGKPIGLLTRRRLVARLASEHADRLGIGISANRGIIRGHMMDGLLGELLPEGVDPDRLEGSLRAVAADGFARTRNDWISSVYRDYLARLEEANQFDPRSVHALLASAIDDGRLATALGDARELHVYGLYTLRSRERLLTALAAQTDVDVALYTLREEESSEWDALAERLELDVEDLDEGEELDEAAATEPLVQPAPDGLREYRWIAAQVKHRLVQDDIVPHEIAIVARQGREDTRRAVTALEAAGIACTARVRMPLCDIGALKALLGLFRGAASDWSYRPLRNVLTSPYFKTGLDLRGIDFAAGQRRVSGLESWAEALEKLAHAKEAGADRDLGNLGVHPDRLREDAGRLRELATQLTPLSDARPERDWVQLTIGLITDGVLGLRKRASTPVGERWDVVRFDQRGLRQLERLLREWAELDLPADRLAVGEWHRLLERLLEAHELALSTPGQKGVQVLEAHDAAMTPFRVVYLAHANDREFPRAHAPGGVLLEEERAALRRAGLPIADRDLDLRRERTLWRAAVQGDAVTISYRTTDPQGTPLLPSLMVPAHDPSNELPRSYEPVGAGVVGAEEERRVAAVALRRGTATWESGGTWENGETGNDPPPSAGNGAEAGSTDRPDNRGPTVETADPSTLHRAIVAAHAETSRGVRDPRARVVSTPNPWHGELRDPYVLDQLGARYGGDRVWSQSQLEAYSTCPFVYLVDRVLWLRGAEEAEEEASPMTFGGIAHDLLQEFYDAVKADLPASFDGPTEHLFHQVADRVFRQRVDNGEWVGLPVLWRYTGEEIRSRVAAYLEWELEHLAKKGERPVWCELELRRDDGEPVELVGPDLAGRQQTLRFTGRIDRVDVTGDGDDARYHILDYKSSSVPKKGGYGDGTVLQAPLYMEALELLKGVRSGKGRYRIIKKPGDPADGCKVKSGSDDYESALRFAFSIPARIRAGLFEPVVAATQGWAFYHPGIEVTRTRAKIESGSRFDAHDFDGSPSDG